LEHERTVAFERIHELRAQQDQQAFLIPGDGLDESSSMAEVETYAALIEQAQQRLRAIDFCLGRLYQGLYGICAQCGDEIAIERLRAIPFAAYCLECQGERNRKTRPSKEWIDKPFLHQWDLPEKMRISSDLPRGEYSPGPEELAIEVTGETSARSRRNIRRGQRTID
jgi:DnaK suppressor protein